MGTRIVIGFLAAASIVVLTGCGHSKPRFCCCAPEKPAPKPRPLTDPEPAVIERISRTISQTSTQPIGLAAPINPSIWARRIRAVGRDHQQLNTSEEYFALLSPNTLAEYTTDGWLKLPDPGGTGTTWALLRVPHVLTTNVWGSGLFPWLLGARINGGVDGITLNDTVIAHHATVGGATTTRLFVSPSDGNTTGWYLFGSTMTPFASDHYVELGPELADTPKALPIANLPAAVRDEIGHIRQLARELEVLP